MLSKKGIRAIVGRGADAALIDGVHKGLNEYGPKEFQRIPHFCAQIFHESAHLRTTTEYASGIAYEGRADLGNTIRGDGKRFRGRGLIQNTGRGNYTRFLLWARRNYADVPDFLAYPEKLAEFPWAYIVSYWYWNKGNPTGKSLNLLADKNDIVTITRRINGGVNGLEDRTKYYTRTALVLLEYKLTRGVIAKFQKANGLVVDGKAGINTRTTLHSLLRLAGGPALQPDEAVRIRPVTTPSKTPWWVTLLRTIFEAIFRRK